MGRPKLKHIDDFRGLLQNYQPGSEARKLLTDLDLVLLMGPTSSGRNTIINELLKTGDYHFIVSDTTRPKRINNSVEEQDGVEYWFRTEDEVLADLQAGNYLEAAIIHDQQVSGMSIRELRKASEMHKIAINEVQPDGANAVWHIKPNTKFVFVLPPSFGVWMQRLRGRSAMPEEEIRSRLESALVEITRALEESYYNLVINDEFHACTKLLHSFFKIGELDTTKEEAARSHAVQLLEDIHVYLNR
jgi:guanylate kinase